jgi:hypothetical protein
MCIYIYIAICVFHELKNMISYFISYYSIHSNNYLFILYVYIYIYIYINSEREREKERITIHVINKIVIPHTERALTILN